MGRSGRQRAKQAKVAREVKYRALPTDLEALQRELTSPDDRGSHYDSGDDDYASGDSDHGVPERSSEVG